MTMRAKDIVAALRRHYPPERWAFFPELMVRDGMAREDRRLDIWACSVLPSDNFCRVSYEVKVSRSDWLSEVGSKRGRPGAAKRRLGLLYSNEFWFATPVGLAKLEEVPAEAGLIEIDAAGQCRTVKPAPWRETLPPTWALLATVARRTQREEQRPMAEIAELALHEAMGAAVNKLVNLSTGVLERMGAGAKAGDPDHNLARWELLQAVKQQLEEEALAHGVEWMHNHGIFSK